MTFQLLVSTLNQNDYSLLDNMNIQTDSIIINQCDKYYFDEFIYKENKIKFYSFNERGDGLSRNNALMRATGDICLFADEDVTYVENYEKIILNAFEIRPKADIIVFNVPSTNKDRPTYIINKNKKVRWFNCLRYGAVKIAIRTEKVRSANIFFSLNFGGGAKYCSGEDSLFIAECIKKGLKVFTCKDIIGYVSQKESTWFNGYNEKFFYDKGVFFACLSKRWAKLLCFQLLLRHKEMRYKNKNIFSTYKIMRRGIQKTLC